MYRKFTVNNQLAIKNIIELTLLLMVTKIQMNQEQS